MGRSRGTVVIAVMGFGLAACSGSPKGSGNTGLDAGGSSPDSGVTLGTGGSVSSPTDIGRACIPSEEGSPTFPGFNVDEVTVDTQAGCADACVVVNFDGRVSCPYGQASAPTNPAQVSSALTESQRCYLPGATPSQAAEVTVPVTPELASRSAEKAVYCSCSCGGGPGPHCACPSGFDCAPLARGIAGSYCVKSGTEISTADTVGQRCAVGTTDCGAPDPALTAAAETGAGKAGDVVTSLIAAINVGPGHCLPIELDVTNGETDCTMVEATSNPSEADCTARPGRKNASAVVASAAIAQLKALYGCDDPQIPTPPCNTFTVCEIQAADPSCLQVTPDPTSIGWCYVAPNQGVGDPALVASCPPEFPRILRFVDPQGQTPAKDASVLLACGALAKP